MPSDFVEEYIGQQRQRTREHVQQYVDMEETTPFTLNDHYYTDAKDKFLEKMVRDLHAHKVTHGLVKPRATPAPQYAGDPVPPPPTTMQLMADLSTEDRRALDIMASTFAFFKVGGRVDWKWLGENSRWAGGGGEMLG